MSNPIPNDQKNYWNDPRPHPETKLWICCDCRNEIKIEFVATYPHGPQDISCCPVCGASAEGKYAAFYSGKREAV